MYNLANYLNIFIPTMLLVNTLIFQVFLLSFLSMFVVFFEGTMDVLIFEHFVCFVFHNLYMLGFPSWLENKELTEEVVDFSV